ncbi:hypothetical protein ABPG72_007993 [Tetrahymena utriculariae]
MSTDLIAQAEQQRTYNLFYSIKLLIENQFNGISESFNILNSASFKYQSKKIAINENFTPIQCSMRSSDKRECPKYIYNEQKKNFLYLEQWFHNNIYQFDKLSSEQKFQLQLVIITFEQIKTILFNQLQKSTNFMFLSKPFYLNKRDDLDLISVSFYSNTFPDSMITVAPSSKRDMSCNGLNNLENYDTICRSGYKNAYNSKNIEYNSSTCFNPQDRISFNNSVNYISQFAQNGSYDIVSRTNTSNFFFKFKRQNQTYLSILYPVMVMSIQSSFTKEVIHNKPMLIGRVQKDRTHILEEVTLQFLPLKKNSIVLKIELAVVEFVKAKILYVQDKESAFSDCNYLELEITNFLENNQFIQDIAKYDSLQLINQIQEKQNAEKDPFLKDELEKYKKTKINMWILIEIDPLSNISQFERYQSYINQMIHQLNVDDGIQQMFQLQSKCVIDWVDIYSYALRKMQQKNQDIAGQLKQKKLKIANDLQGIQEKQVVFLLTSNQNINFKINKLTQVLPIQSQILKGLEKDHIFNPSQVRSYTQSPFQNARSNSENKSIFKNLQNKEEKEEDQNPELNIQQNEIEVENDSVITELFQQLGINYVKSSDYSYLQAQIKNLRYKKIQHKVNLILNQRALETTLVYINIVYIENI